jgi:ferric iron reductase protein FhuF
MFEGRMAGSGEVEESAPRPGFRTLEEVSLAGSDELIECAELADPDRQREIEERLLPGEDAHRNRIRRSWIWVDYAGILLSRVAEAWVLEGGVADTSAANSVVMLGQEGFEEFFLRVGSAISPAGGISTGSPAEPLYRSAIDEHLEPVLRAASASSRVGLHNLWGSVASTIVRVTGEACRGRDIDVPVDRLQAFLDGRAELSDKGTIVRSQIADRRGIVGFHRATCCLWFRVDPGQMCGDCVLSTRERVLATLEAVAADGAEHA